MYLSERLLFLLLIILSDSVKLSHFFFSACQEGNSTFDQCGQRCACRGGRLVDCVRIRKEFTSMTLEERRRYVRVIRTASTNPRFKRLYDDLINEHRTLFIDNLSGLFQPHGRSRFFLLNCGF